MKIGFAVYPDVTILDIIGVYDPLMRLKKNGYIPDLQGELCAMTGEITDNYGLATVRTVQSGSLAGYDMVVIPGGDIQTLVRDPLFIGWIRTAEACPRIAALCGGSILLGAAGLLKGKRATTHPSFFPLLERFCGRVERDRIVDDGNLVTAGGVTAGIDLGLYLCEQLAGKEATEKIREQMDYRQPEA